MDGLGSTRNLTNDSAVVTDRYVYDAFGTIVDSSGTGNHQPYAFAGEQLDDETGLIYLRARFYAPNVGSVLGRDPFDGVRHLPQTLSPYLYVLNNPVNNIDPSGEITLLELVVGFAVVAAVVWTGFELFLDFSEKWKFKTNADKIRTDYNLDPLPNKLAEAHKDVFKYEPDGYEDYIRYWTIIHRHDWEAGACDTIKIGLQDDKIEKELKEYDEKSTMYCNFYKELETSGFFRFPKSKN